MPYDTREKERKLIELLLEADDEGLSTSELAQALDVTPQTVRNFINRLRGEGVSIQEVEGTRGYSIDKRAYLRPMRLRLEQAWMLYLPLRRMVRAQLHRYPVVFSLLHRITEALNPELADALLPEADLSGQSVSTVFKALVDGWNNGCWVEIQYQPLDKTYPTSYRIAPYWFEPAVWSDSIYLIAGVQQRSGIAPLTLKLERILSARLLPNLSYERPATEQILKRVEATWGIWGSDQEVVEVTLRFHYRVKARLEETRWHPTQHIHVEENGYVRWAAQIAEPREMLPWIRGWGADVEVLAPHWLRQEIASEAERTARLYGRGGERQLF
jgi:CRISPR-associated endonuclease/helicase Cas3